jgi:hypothetical protein
VRPEQLIVALEPLLGEEFNAQEMYVELRHIRYGDLLHEFPVEFDVHDLFTLCNGLGYIVEKENGMLEVML